MKNKFIKRMTTLVYVVILTVGTGCSGMAAVSDTGFSDVSGNAYYADAVNYCKENGLMNGTSATIFSPETTTSRAQLITILWREAGSPASRNGEFSDVPTNAYYATAAAWAKEQDIITGYSDGRFAPNDSISRVQLSTILWRINGSPIGNSQTAFADQNSIPSYATDAAAWAQASGIINGKSGNVFDPNGNATRAQTATILYRYFINDNQSDQGSQGNENNQLEENRQIEIITGQGNSIVFQLNDSPAASALYNQLPLTVPVENYGSNEKIFYITEKLDTSNTPLAQGPAGTLTYYEPWGNVAIFYGECGGAGGLYELGEVVSGVSYISEMTGELQIRARLDI